MGIYASVGGYGGAVSDTPFYALTSFGNMGFAKTLCAKVIISPSTDGTQQLSFKCEGTTVID